MPITIPDPDTRSLAESIVRKIESDGLNALDAQFERAGINRADTIAELARAVVQLTPRLEASYDTATNPEAPRVILNGHRVRVHVEMLPAPPDDIEPPIDQTPHKLMTFDLDTRSWSQLISLRVRAEGFPFLGDRAPPWPRGVGVFAWTSVEEIAKYVAGDGTDPQRVALADGILSGRRED